MSNPPPVPNPPVRHGVMRAPSAEDDARWQEHLHTTVKDEQVSIVERLRRTFEIGVDADHLTLAPEPGWAYRNPDGPKAAALIEELVEGLERIRDRIKGGLYVGAPEAAVIDTLLAKVKPNGLS